MQVSAATESGSPMSAGERAGLVPTAVVLVGGEGTRLRPLTERIPKPMLPLLGRPILAHTFEQVAAAGASRVILACGYRPTSIEAFFGGSYRGMELEYQVEPEVLELIPKGRPVSIEREIFPILSARGVLYALPLPGYWLDVGTPESYLQAHLDLMPKDVQIDPTAVVAPTARFHGPCVVEAGCVVEAAADLGPGVYLGAGSRVGPGARIRRTALLPGAIVEGGAVDRAIVDPNHGVVPVGSS
jgi:NDP-sugar pyrophosphorylase family protein